MKRKNQLHTPLFVACAVSIMLFGAPLSQVWAATDLANSPIAMNRDNSALVKPNIAFIMDDSLSMNYQNMPRDDSAHSGRYCKGWYKYNTVAYNPNYTYIPPFHPDTARYPNNRFPNAKFSDALEDGYFPSRGQTYNGGNRTNVGRKLSETSNLPNSAYYYTYPKSAANADSTDCLDNDDYTRVREAKDIRAPNTTPGSPDALQNYANWYSYYRRRAYLMKFAAGEAFKNLEADTYRVGLFFLNSNQSGADSTNRLNDDLKIADFNGTQRIAWYDRLYTSRANTYTPLRGALSRIGRMYAGQFAGWDPVQYSCQQNFALLSTDGHWNTTSENSNYRPSGITGNLLGDIDGRDVNINNRTPLSPPYVDNNNESNTLADVALYFYQTDLRTSDLKNCTNRDGLTNADLCENNVKASGNNRNEAQHMVTFTLGLGVDGTLPYDIDYVEGPAEIMNGTKSWPSASAGEGEKIDDLWHAAINGRGRYFSAKDPTTLTEGLEKALAKMAPQSGNAAAAASSSLEQGEDRVYVALYRTVNWDGDVHALNIDISGEDSAIVVYPPAWEAQAKLDVTPHADRKIWYLGDGENGKVLKSFTFPNLSSDGKGEYFADLCSKTPRVAQCGNETGDLPVADRPAANNGTNLVSYLRGSREHEDKESNSGTRLYRARDHVLGDIVHSNPEYVKYARFNYADPSYQLFKDKQGIRDRAPSLYVGANDGMLHAFDAASGEEKWAYVPGMVMPNMYHLADRNYQHRYFIDGPITVSDICTNVDSVTKQCVSENDWRTILVSGLGKGGCGYFALDITNPDEPQGLWEVSASTPGMQNLGFSYGNPIVTMNKQGEWVVIFASGYNNVPGAAGCAGSSGDGNGHVYVLNAKTGQLKKSIPTMIKNGDGTSSPAGTTANPSGLAKLNAWINDPTVPVADRIYGGDLLGNVWRIDFDNNYDHGDSVRLAVLRDGSAPTPRLQPITTRPELATFRVGASSYDVVLVGTGKLLGISDMSDTSQQSLYALKDTLGSTGIANVRSSNMTQFAMTDTNGVRKLQQGQSMSWPDRDGWLIDFNPQSKSPGERVNVNMELLNFDDKLELWFGTNVPFSNPCNVGGYAIEYSVNVLDPMESGASVGEKFLSTFFTGLKAHVADRGDNGTDRYRVVTGADGGLRLDRNRVPRADPPVVQPPPTPPTPPVLRRTSWREIVLD